MTGIPIIAALVILLIVAAFLLSSWGRSILAFFRLLSAGFTASQIAYLKGIAKSAGLSDLFEILRSSAALDKCAAEMLRRARNGGMESDKKIQDALSALYGYRRKVELDESRKRRGIATTRDIPSGQPLHIVYSGVGSFSSRVIENSQSFLTIDLPRAPSVMSTKIDWSNRPLKVFFHRADDAGYVFLTSALPPDSGDRRAVLRLKHTGKVGRFQMRQSPRAKCSIPAQLYVLESGESPDELESEGGIECVLQDLSGAGAMIRAGAEVSRGARIKIQFMIQDEPIIMSGAAKEASYSAAKGETLINFECARMSPAMRNTVLAFVYNVLPESEEIAEADFMANGDAKKH